MFKRFILIISGLLVALSLLAQTSTHVVKRGDTVKSIAAKYGVTEQQILDANPGIMPSALIVGTEITIPSAQAAPKKQNNKIVEEKPSPKSEVPETVPPAVTPAPSVEQPSFSERVSDISSGSANNIKQYTRGFTLGIWGGTQIVSESRSKNIDRNWSLEFAVGYDFDIDNSPMFVSLHGLDFSWHWTKTKGAKEGSSTFYYLWPFQMGVGDTLGNFRMGCVIGGCSQTTPGAKETPTYFVSGLRFSLNLLIDINFQMLWIGESSAPVNMISFGLRF